MSLIQRLLLLEATCPKCGQDGSWHRQDPKKGLVCKKFKRNGEINPGLEGTPTPNPIKSKQPVKATKQQPTGVHAWLGEHNITGATVTDNNVINASGVVLIHEDTDLPYKFGTVGGLFLAETNKIADCTNFPDSVGGMLFIDSSSLTSLQGAPKIVGTKKTSADTALFIRNSTNLKSLDGIPSNVNGSIKLHNLGITSLLDIQEKIKRMNGVFEVHNCKITNAIVGLIAIPGITGVSFENCTKHDAQINAILNKYAKTNDVMGAQDALLDADLEDLATYFGD